MMKQLQKRREALRRERKRLNSKASLRTDVGRRYVRCLVMLAMTEMHIAELQGNKKDRFAERPW